jgi:hypothetical protein
MEPSNTYDYFDYELTESDVATIQAAAHPSPVWAGKPVRACWWPSAAQKDELRVFVGEPARTFHLPVPKNG